MLSEGKITKYLKYAVGEILLVVIGILIVLQVNNWDEGSLLNRYKSFKIHETGGSGDHIESSIQSE